MYLLYFNKQKNHAEKKDNGLKLSKCVNFIAVSKLVPYTDKFYKCYFTLVKYITHNFYVSACWTVTNYQCPNAHHMLRSLPKIYERIVLSFPTWAVFCNLWKLLKSKWTDRPRGQEVNSFLYRSLCGCKCTIHTEGAHRHWRPLRVQLYIYGII